MEFFSKLTSIFGEIDPGSALNEQEENTEQEKERLNA